MEGLEPSSPHGSSRGPVRLRQSPPVSSPLVRSYLLAPTSFELYVELFNQIRRPVCRLDQRIQLPSLPRDIVDLPAQLRDFDRRDLLDLGTPQPVDLRRCRIDRSLEDVVKERERIPPCQRVGQSRAVRKRGKQIGTIDTLNQSGQLLQQP